MEGQNPVSETMKAIWDTTVNYGKKSQNFRVEKDSNITWSKFSPIRNIFNIIS